MLMDTHSLGNKRATVITNKLLRLGGTFKSRRCRCGLWVLGNKLRTHHTHKATNSKSVALKCCPDCWIFIGK